jgi:predicted nucleotidyltransferase
MKELANEQVVILKNYGNSHVYELNKSNRIVLEILKPMFKKESVLLDNFINDLVLGIKKSELKNNIFSVVLFGSVQEGKEKPGSDIDLCVVVNESKDKKAVEDLIFSIDSTLMSQLGMGIEPYIKSISEFKKDKELGVIKSILKSNRVIWGQNLEKIL